ncbi:DUF6660 family protein [uncultured Arcticibacterium sp.]|uniref:DUF6660 family protein n=1 Tax=uncultured Arcticibacterium sp. TaxID=2173042 RepID=UPI0030F72B40
MRLTTFILSISVLLMAIMPCGDDFLLSVKGNVEGARLVDRTHQHQDGEEDDCSPFCLCQCCGSSFAFDLSLVPLKLWEFTTYSYSFNYSFNYTGDFSVGVWHPPTQS